MRFLRLRPLAAAGLRQLIDSIDSAKLAEHECNRGFAGTGASSAEGIARARACGLRAQASVTVSRLVRYDELREVSSLFRRSVGQSLWALVKKTPKMLRLARRQERAATRMQLSRIGRPSNARREGSNDTNERHRSAPTLNGSPVSFSGPGGGSG